ncbi:hypothetical protein BVRB_3g064840 [Beta vulgaris subsp. vulgaris]|nr:hypothetical protein BVRB_3g064840 [Beta vulgaris subsp. vulgaris]
MVATNTASQCLESGEYCSNDGECCAGTSCSSPTPVLPGEVSWSTCRWCPTPGYSCGLADPCCPGYTCDGWFFGTCH